MLLYRLLLLRDCGGIDPVHTRYQHSLTVVPVAIATRQDLAIDGCRSYGAKGLASSFLSTP